MELRLLKRDKFPEILSPLLETPEPPESLYLAGKLPDSDTILLTVVGSRKHTGYGRDICEMLVRGLSGYKVAIVSGLALGIDGIAHRTAINVGIHTIAFPGSGLSPRAIYPKEHFYLAKEIIESGGALISEFEPEFEATPWSFPKRNRLMAGLSKATLVIEAEERSGTLITARLALDYGRDVFAVPGPITSPSSKGTNFLIRQGATPITSSEELLQELGIKTIEKKESVEVLSPEEIYLINLLNEPKSRSDIAQESKLSMNTLNATLSILEIKGLIGEEGGLVYKK